MADSVRVGDRFVLALVAEHEAGTAAAFPAPHDSLRFGDLEVLGQAAQARYERAGLQVDSVVYEVTTFALDSARVPPIPVRFTRDDPAAAGGAVMAATDSFFVPVVSLVPPDAQGVRDLAPLVEFPAPIWPWVLLAAGIVLLVALLAYYAWRRRNRPPAPEPAEPPRVLTPFEEAEERLNALESRDLRTPEAVKPYYVELSDVVRVYLARRTGVAAMERTTRELMRELERRTAVPADGRDGLRTILDLADFVKFADAHPPAERSRAVVAEAREVLGLIERALRRREAAETPEARPETARVPAE